MVAHALAHHAHAAGGCFVAQGVASCIGSAVA